MKSKILIAFGIITYILSVISSTENIEGAYVMPYLLIILSGVLSLLFIILTTVYLWKKHKTASIIFLVSFLIPLVYLSPLIKIINIAVLIWVMVILWGMRKDEKNNSKI